MRLRNGRPAQSDAGIVGQGAMTRIPAFLAAALALGGCAVAVTPAEPGPPAAGSPGLTGLVLTPVPPGEELTGPVFLAIVSGNTLLAEGGTGRRAILFIAADGTIRMLVWGEDGQKSRAGKMELVDGKACTRFADENGGRPDCFRTFKDGERIHTVKDAGETVGATWWILPGNAANL
jgi:hypothetical protein